MRPSLPMKFAQALRRLAAKAGFQRDWYLMMIAALIGLLMSGVAMAFILPLRWIEQRGEDSVSVVALWWLIPTLPVAGALACGVVNHFISAHGEGPGVTKVMFALYRRKARIPFVVAPRKWLASTFTIASGGSAGAEGPIVTIGAVIGSGVGQLLRLTSQNTATLVGCGAAAGISSVFNAPIAGVFFVMEILLRDFSIRTFTPIIIASVVSAGATREILGGDALFATGHDFAVGAFTLLEIPNYLMLGVIAGAVAAIFIRTLYFMTRRFESLPVHPIVRPACGAAILGILGLLYFASGLGSGHPEFYGNGYPVIRELLAPPHYYGEDGALLPLGGILLALLALGVLKAVATCLTIGSGGAGGMFAPSLLLGATIGGAFGVVVNALGWFPAASPAHYALVGMAAVVAATTHAPLTAILIVYEITQSYEIILPLMFAAVISTIVARLVFRESVYTVKLTDQGVRVGAMSDLTILRRLEVNEVELVPPVMVHPEDSAQRLLDLSEKHAVSDFVVVDAAYRYVGLVTATDLKDALVYREAIPLLQVHELQRANLPVVRGHETLDVVLDKFARHDVQSLAVLGGTDGSIVRGLITRERLMRRYQAALSEG